ncbi:MAG: lipoyl(octanoyl) transferase LipB [Burkholderiaceae bacterium]|nr:lipoyl(octanoyl) transferase LipB [Burkholderiaceae bacterium]
MRTVNLGRRPYREVEEAMRRFTHARGDHGDDRGDADDDELWLVEHEPVFTQGLAGREAHVLAAGDIPVVRTDRGGQVTYHGPGQVVAYPLLDLKRRGYFVREYVFRLEQAVIDVLAGFGLTGHRVRTAPGVYVRLAEPAGHAVLELNAGEPLRGLGKIAALGIKVSRHCTYHGVALNVAMDLEPFTRIDPCGYKGLVTVDLATLGVRCTWDEAAARLAEALVRRLA